MNGRIENDRIRTFPGLLELIRSYGSRPALRFEGKVCSYEEFASNVARRVDFIRGLNFAPGTHLGLPGRNTPDTLELLLAIPAAGHVTVLLPESSLPSGLPELCKRMDLAGTFGFDWSTGEIGEHEAPCADVSFNTRAAIFLTSGTTGQPKGVIHSHGSLMESVYNASTCIEGLWPCRTVTLLPMHHIFGAVILLTALFSGSFIHMDTDLRKILSDLPQIGPDFMAAVPGLMETIFALSRLQGPGYLESVRAIGCGGAAVPVPLVRKAQDAGIRLITGYGMTETGGFTAVNPDAASDLESVGTLCRGLEARIDDGELLVRGESVMKGYYNDPEENAKAMPDGWLRTGDLARFDDRGRLVITGRKKELIILGNGENVSPAELEALLKKYPEVRECRVSETMLAGHRVIGAELQPGEELSGKHSEDEVLAIMENIVEKTNAQLPPFKKILTWKIMKGDETPKCWKN